MKKKNIAQSLIPFSLIFLLMSNIAYGANQYCVDNKTLRIITEYTIEAFNITQVNVTKDKPCPYGCVNDECVRSTSYNWMFAILIIFGALVIILMIWWFMR